MTDTISIKEIIKIMLKNLWIVLLCAIVAGGALGLVAKSKQSTDFISERDLTIGHNLQSQSNINPNSQLNADLNMIPTYADLVKDKSILKSAHSKLPKKIKKQYTTTQLKSAIDVSTKPDSLVIELKAKTSSSKSSVAIVNAVATAVKDEMPELQADSGEVTLLAKATSAEVTTVTHPSIKKYAVLGFALGALLGIIIAFTRVTWKKFV